ncbi:hypothetical protein SBA4_2020005 [Candidatus Sulfopaludibacter sp. SbA4]|nr:hypothetical protein SBA4_2020005 [Candidatus Sulfopaludibacter sp. SbA4]
MPDCGGTKYVHGGEKKASLPAPGDTTRIAGMRSAGPKRIFDRDEVMRLRDCGLSIERTARQLRIGVGTVVRVIQAAEICRVPFQKASA